MSAVEIAEANLRDMRRQLNELTSEVIDDNLNSLILAKKRYLSVPHNTESDFYDLINVIAKNKSIKIEI